MNNSQHVKSMCLRRVELKLSLSIRQFFTCAQVAAVFGNWNLLTLPDYLNRITLFFLIKIELLYLVINLINN